ncbi:MAG: hypothetical protein ACTSX6_14710 [Candidatus Heimdallarchaeaceae archaeon]
MSSASEIDGAFQEICLVGITKKGGSEIQFAGAIEDVSTMTEGDKGGSSIVLCNGGRLWKRDPEGDAEFTVKIYPLDLDPSSGNDLAQYFLGTSGSGAPISVTNTHTRDLFRVAFLVTDDPSASTAGGSTASGYAARRLVLKNARVTSYKDSWADKVLSADVTFTVSPFDASGTGTITRESVTSSDGTGLSALSEYS